MQPVVRVAAEDRRVTMLDLDLILALIVAVTLVVHEIGHVLAAVALRLHWRPILTWHGPAVVIGRDDLLLTRRQLVLTSAGGPLANIALCAVAYLLGQGLVVAVGLEILFWNLLPWPRSDGLKMLWPGRAIAKALEALEAQEALEGRPKAPLRFFKRRLGRSPDPTPMSHGGSETSRPRTPDRWDSAMTTSSVAATLGVVARPRVERS
jgi:hypothetical protein